MSLVLGVGESSGAPARGEACPWGGPMERDNRAGMDSDGIIHGGDASFGAPDQAQLSTFHISGTARSV